MTTQSPTNAGGSKYVLDKLIAVALVVWLLFFGGFSTIKNVLTPARLSQITSAVDTIKTGADRVTRGAPTTRPIPTQRTSGQPPANPPRPPLDQAAAEQAADIAYQATVQAVNALQPPAQPAVQPNALPTAAIVYPTAIPIEQVTVVPIAMPQLTSNDPPTITPIPTLVYPTPLPPAAAAFTLSPDGKCVTVARADGEYQTCQDWPYSAAEAASVADYLRTGLIPGTKVG